MRIVPLAEQAAPLRAAYGLVYRPAAIPAGTYGSAESVGTVAIPDLVVCGPGTPAPVVRAVVGALFDGRAAIARTVPAADALDRRSAIETDPVPLHPAAAAWFRERKAYAQR
ncbi:hypothetical protein GCM10025868_07110 [Angustibacter aerolatus]|uniref:Uncharacterized protein n=1 Tax=Angustibacter aerolatus TaxID=1162965 RepID=A0ABQ6JF96_9ACTN|nr:hypothetical protein GCM10025868_07110 [Angustibacter aerolatus]